MASLAERFRRRIRSELFNARRGVGLLGWHRDAGPSTIAGAAVRTRAQPRSSVPVVLCVWRRPERLETTLASLSSQSIDSLRLWIWNNNLSLKRFVDETVAEVADIHVDVIHSTRNIGGFGRFYVARQLAAEHPYVLFLDDDQVPAPDFVESLVGEFEPKTIRGAWAFRFRRTRSYWDRFAPAPGERVKFCGNGGMICDTQVFLETALFKCPRRFWFVEDLWLSYYADHVLDWRLFKSGASIVEEPDDQGQYESLFATKDFMLRYLVRKGWDPLLPESASASDQ